MVQEARGWGTPVGKKLSELVVDEIVFALYGCFIAVLEAHLAQEDFIRAFNAPVSNAVTAQDDAEIPPTIRAFLRSTSSARPASSTTNELHTSSTEVARLVSATLNQLPVQAISLGLPQKKSAGAAHSSFSTALTQYRLAADADPLRNDGLFLWRSGVVRVVPEVPSAETTRTTINMRSVLVGAEKAIEELRLRDTGDTFYRTEFPELADSDPARGVDFRIPSLAGALSSMHIRVLSARVSPHVSPHEARIAFPESEPEGGALLGAILGASKDLGERIFAKRVLPRPQQGTNSPFTRDSDGRPVRFLVDGDSSSSSPGDFDDILANLAILRTFARRDFTPISEDARQASVFVETRSFLSAAVERDALAPFVELLTEVTHTKTFLDESLEIPLGVVVKENGFLIRVFRRIDVTTFAALAWLHHKAAAAATAESSSHTGFSPLDGTMETRGVAERVSGALHAFKPVGVEQSRGPGGTESTAMRRKSARRKGERSFTTQEGDVISTQNPLETHAEWEETMAENKKKYFVQKREKKRSSC